MNNPYWDQVDVLKCYTCVRYANLYLFPIEQSHKSYLCEFIISRCKIISLSVLKSTQSTKPSCSEPPHPKCNCPKTNPLKTSPPLPPPIMQHSNPSNKNISALTASLLLKLSSKDILPSAPRGHFQRLLGKGPAALCSLGNNTYNTHQ